MPLVVALAIGVGTLPRLLATRAIVYGGQISFCLYMLHELVHTSWNWAARQFDLTLTGGPGKLIVARPVRAVPTGGGAALPRGGGAGRKWLRRMLDARPPTDDLRRDTAGSTEGGGAVMRTPARDGPLWALTMLTALTVPVTPAAWGAPAASTAPASRIAVIGDSYTTGSTEGGWAQVGRPGLQMLATQGFNDTGGVGRRRCRIRDPRQPRQPVR